jgi:hypothetical protein
MVIVDDLTVLLAIEAGFGKCQTRERHGTDADPAR